MPFGEPPKTTQHIIQCNYEANELSTMQYSELPSTSLEITRDNVAVEWKVFFNTLERNAAISAENASNLTALLLLKTATLIIYNIRKGGGAFRAFINRSMKILGVLLSHTVTQYGQKIVSTGRNAKINLGLPRFPEFERVAGRRNK